MKCFNRLIIGNLFILLFFVIISNSGIAKDNNSYQKEVVAKMGDEKVTFGDIEKAYKKNMNRKDAEIYLLGKDSIYDFINLYINYKLKVKDALSRGFDKDSSVIYDIAQNKKVLAESFLYEKKLTEPEVNRMIKLRGLEFKLAVIMTSLPPEPNHDTTVCYNKIRMILDSLNKGMDFATAAHKFSDDKETAKLGGEIPTYITAGKIIRQIENAIYSLNTGEWTKEPVKTNYGYFIIKVLDKAKRIDVKFSHILLQQNQGLDSLSLNHKADSLIALLKKGADFSQLAHDNSDDNATASNGGSFGHYYSRSFGFEGTMRHVLPNMEQILFSLKDGQISEKLFTEYGVHIVRRDSSKNYDPETDREEVKKIYKRTYFEPDKALFIDSLRNVYSFKVNQPVMSSLLSMLDTNKTNLDSTWQKRVTDDIREKTLYSILKQDTKVGHFLSEIQTRSEYRGTPLNDKGLRKVIDKMTEPLVINEAIKPIEKDYPELDTLLTEFRDGILLFKVEAQEIWDKLKFDTALARKYYDTTKTRYNTDVMYDIKEIYVMSKEVSDSLYENLQNGAIFDTLASIHSQRAGFREKCGAWGRVSIRKDSIAKAIYKLNYTEPGLKKPFKFEKGYSIVYVNKIEPPRQKTFEEAISDFASGFQDIVQKSLTDKWISNIKQKFPVDINKDKISDIVKQLRKNN